MPSPRLEGIGLCAVPVPDGDVYLADSLVGIGDVQPFGRGSQRTRRVHLHRAAAACQASGFKEYCIDHSVSLYGVDGARPAQDLNTGTIHPGQFLSRIDPRYEYIGVCLVFRTHPMAFIQGEHTLGDGGTTRLPQVDVRPVSGLFQGGQAVQISLFPQCSQFWR